MRTFPRLRLLVIGLAVATGWSCTETIVGIVDIASLEIEPASTSVYIGADVTLEARLKDERGNTLSGRQLEWLSEHPQIATVNGSGLVHGVAVGTADIVASSEGVRRTARVTVMPRPIIHVENDSAAFTLVRGGLATPVGMEITNTGGGTLTGISVSAQYEGTATGWLDTQLSAADAPATLALAPAPDGLEPGTYRATVRINAPDAANSPVTLNVRLALLRPEPAHISVAVGNGQQAIAGTTVSSPIGVLVSDANDNPLENAVVTFVVASGGGELSDAAPVMTDDSGLAMAPAWRLGDIAGPNTLKATVDGLAGDSIIITATGIAGAPAQLTITTEPSASAPSGAAFVRQPVVQLRDVGGNPVSQTGVVVTAAISAGGGALDGSVSIPTDAAGAARFTDLAIVGPVGERTLEFMSERLTSATSSAIAITTGAGTQFGLVAQPSAAARSGVAFDRQPSLQLQDAGGNPVSQAGILVSAAIATGGGTLGGTVSTTTGANGVAAFTDLRITGIVGTRTLRFSASGITAATSDPVAVAVGPASAAHSAAIVNDGTAGEPTQIDITVHDDGGNPVTDAAPSLAISVTGANTAAPTVTETGSGAYAATYIPTSTGTDEVVITLAGEAIAGSPFASTVTPSGVSVSNSSVSLSPTGSVTADGQDTVAVTVVLRDSIGNPISGLASSIHITLSGSASVGPVAETSTTGTYMFNLTSTVANLVGIVLTVGGATLADKPTVEFEAGAITATSTVTATTGVLANGVAAATVQVTLVDQFGNPINGLTDGDFEIGLTGSAGGTATRSTVTGTGNAYSFTVSNSVAETITVTITADEVLLSTAPEIEFIAGTVSPSLSTTTADRLTDVTADGSDASLFEVNLVDDLGNPKAGLTGVFIVSVGNGGTAINLTETVPGTYTFSVTNTTAGDATVSITVDGVLLDNPLTVNFIAGDVSATGSTIVPTPSTNVTVSTVTGSTVLVTLVDAQGNPVDVPIAQVIATVTGSAVIVGGGVAAGTEPGTYTFLVTNTIAETITVNVTANGIALQNPPTIQFVAGDVSASSTVTAPATTPVSGGTDN